MAGVISLTCSGNLCIKNMGSFTFCSVCDGRCVTVLRIMLKLGVSDGDLGSTGLISSLIPIGIIRKQALTMGL